MTKQEPIAYEFGEFKLDVRTCELRTAKGEVVNLANNPYTLLLFLIENRHRIVKNEEIHYKIWKGDLRGGGNLEDLVSTLRKTLGTKGKEIIITKPKQGRRFGLQVKEIFADESNDETLIPEPLQEVLSEPAPETDDLTADTRTFSAASTITEASGEPSRVEEEKIEPEKTVRADKDADKADKNEIPPSLDTFWGWMIGSGKNVTLLFFICPPLSVLLTSLIFWSFASPKLDETKIFTVSTSITHVVLIAIAIFYEWRYPGTESFPQNSWNDSRRDAISTLKQYKADWAFLLLFWALLYIFQAFITLEPVFQKESLPYSDVWGSAIITAANNINTLLIFRCYNTLNKSDNPAKSPHDNITIISVLYGALITVFFFAELRSPLYKEMFKLFSGIFAGVTMALYFGRFQSKFLKSPEWLLIVFYFYVAIQPLFVYFDNSKYATIIIPAALFSKCLLILYMFWLFESRRLLFYLFRVRRTADQMDKEYWKFYGIWDDERASDENAEDQTTPDKTE